MASIHAERHKNGTRSWRVKWRQDGKQYTKTFGRKSDAELHRARVELGSVDTPAARTVKPTLQDTFEQWLATRRVSRGRIATDRSLSNRFGTLAVLPVDKITPSKVREWLAGLVDAGLSAETIAATLRVLRATLDSAVEDGLITNNPATRVRPPRISRPPLDARDVLTANEVEDLLPLVDDRWRALVALLAYVGPRLSEALGLRVSDLDLLRRRVHLGHHVVEEVNGVIRLRAGGKTRGSDRVVPLPGLVVDQIAEHLAMFPAGRSDLVFRNSAGKPPSRAGIRQRIWQPAIGRLADKTITDAANLDPAGRAEAEERAEQLRSIPTRNLRHTSASLMLQVGLDPLEVARRLGHSRPSMTLDVYSRLLPDHDQDGIDPYDAALRRNIGGTAAAK